MANSYRGIILAGGRGTRLGACTRAVSKQLLPVYDKPMIYYPLSFLLKAGVREIMVITTPEALHSYGDLLRDDWEKWGVTACYAEQDKPGGLAEAYLYAESFLAGHPSVLVLGDNLFHGATFDKLAKKMREAMWSAGNHIVGYEVADPTAYGVVELRRKTGPGAPYAASIEEKPAAPKSKWAVPGLYVLDQQAVTFAKRLQPSARGELEIADLLRFYVDKHHLQVHTCGSGDFWFDAGTPDGLLDAANFVAATQRRTGRLIGCPFEAVKQCGS